MAAPAIGSPVQSVVALRPVRLGSGVSRCWLGSSAHDLHYVTIPISLPATPIVLLVAT